MEAPRDSTPDAELRAQLAEAKLGRENAQVELQLAQLELASLEEQRAAAEAEVEAARAEAVRERLAAEAARADMAALQEKAQTAAGASLDCALLWPFGCTGGGETQRVVPSPCALAPMQRRASRPLRSCRARWRRLRRRSPSPRAWAPSTLGGCWSRCAGANAGCLTASGDAAYCAFGPLVLQASAAKEVDAALGVQAGKHATEVEELQRRLAAAQRTIHEYGEALRHGEAHVRQCHPLCSPGR
jgi:hypothetical protein